MNGYEEERLYKIIKEYGEEAFAKQIARNIVKAREEKPLKTCGELAGIVEKSIPARYRFGGAPCERKTFQAIRIEVNGELNGLYDLVIALTRRLKKGGRIAILTFHSLEDRAVKEAFRFMETPCTCPKSFPVCVCRQEAGNKNRHEKADHGKRRRNRRKFAEQMRKIARGGKNYLKND